MVRIPDLKYYRKMKRMFYLIFLLVLNLNVFSQNEDLLWLSHLTGDGTTVVTESCTDQTGNIYVIGTFSGTITQGSITLNAVGLTDGFIAKYNKNGVPLWINHISGGTLEQPTGVSLSIDGNYVYIAVNSNSIPTVFGSISVNTVGLQDIILAKYSVDGTILWARNAAFGAALQSSARMSIDASDNIVLSGLYRTDVTFYGEGAPHFSTGLATNQLFIAKFDSDLNLIWANEYLTDNNLTQVRTISIDPSGYYFGGSWNGNLTLSIAGIGQLLSNAGNSDMFLYKIDYNGFGVWVRKITGINEDVLMRHKGDVLGNQYITGYFNSPGLTIDSTSSVFSNVVISLVGNNDVYYSCYAPDGTLQFVKTFGSTLSDQGIGVFVNNDHVVLTGQYSEVITFDSFTLTNNGNVDAFMVETDRNGNVLSAKRAYGTNSDIGRSALIAGDNTNIFIGDFQSTTLTIEDKTLTNPLTTTRDMFIAKYGRIVITFAETDANCINSFDGSITTTVTGHGTAPYTYSWSGPNGFTSNAQNPSGLETGWYKLTLTDANLARKVDSTFVDYLPVLSATLNKHAELLICAADDNGEAAVVITNGAAPITYLWDDGSTLGSRNDLDTGWHYVTITDVCAVPIKDSIRVNYLPEVNINITSSSPASCPVGGDGYAFALATSGVPPYNYAWSNSVSTTNEANDLLSGWQYVTVTDFCKTKKDSINVTWSPVVTSTAAIVSKVTCTGLFNGSATVTPTLGKAPYTYLWSNPAAETTATATQLGTGWNYVTVSDACTSTHKDSVFMTIESALTDTVMLNTLASCPTSSNGSATATVLTGVPVYSYLWDDGITTATNNTLTVGKHYVTITDGCGPKVDSVEVTNKPLMQVTLSTQNILLTCALDLGTVTVQVQDGVAPFTYTWDDMIAPGATRTLDTGWHYVTVTDFCNMPYYDSVRVNHLPEVIADIVSSTPSSCPGGGDGIATVQASSGVPPYSYVWSNSAATSATATDLLTGWQYVTVSDYCTSTVDSIEVVANTALSTSITASTPTNCSGAFNGTATVMPANGGGAYTYLWTSNETTATAIALGEGWNYVTVSDACGTNKLDSVMITVQSALLETVALTTQASCPANSDGVATVTVTSGVVPFSYAWSSGGSAAVETGLPVGWVWVTITDGCGPKTDSIEVTNKPLMQVTLSAQNILLTCATDLGTVTVQVQSGVAPFTYSWDDMIAPGATRTLDTGWHYVTVTDFCNIPYYDSVRVNHLPEVVADIVSSLIASCPAGGDGKATVQASSGVPPYSYVWSNSTASTATATDLLSGWQYVTVSDYCTSVVDSVEIGFMPTLAAYISDSSNVSCTGGTNGYATVTASNGGIPYTYIWTSGESTQTASQLQSGWNYVTVTDLCGINIIDSVEIFVNPLISIISIQVSPTTCINGNNGTATLITNGGSAPINYEWSNGQTTQTATGLTNDTIYVTVTDACGSLSTSAYIGYLPQMEIAITANVAVSCSTSTDGKAFVTASLGSGFYTYQWSNSSSVAANALDLPVGWNWVTVTDACGSLTDSVQIGVKPALTGTVVCAGSATCPNSNDGIAVATPSNGVPPYSYAWSGSASTDSMVSDLPVGPITVTITDICGSIVLNINVISLPVMTYSAVTTNLLCFSDSSGTIAVTPSLGVPPYSYAWADTPLVDSARTDLLAGTYTVTISDFCGSAVQAYTITQPGSLSISLLAQNVQFQGETTGSIDLIVSGGTAPYYFAWSNASPMEDQYNLAEGPYSVTVSDINNCLAIDSVEIISLQKHIIIYSAFTPNDDGKNDVWNIKHIQNFPNCEISIYNEWGIVVFKSTGYTEPWDGTKEGSALPAASYYYVIDLKDGSEAYTGSVTLMK